MYIVIPVDCIDVNNPLKDKVRVTMYNSNLGSDFYKDRSHGIDQSHFMGKYFGEKKQKNKRLLGDYSILKKTKVEASHNDLRSTRDNLKADITNLEKEYYSLEETKNDQIASLQNKVKKQDKWLKILVAQQNQLIKEKNLSLSRAVFIELEQNDQTVENRHLKDELDKSGNAITELEAERDKVKEDTKTIEAQLALALKDSDQKEAEIVKLKANLENIQKTSKSELEQVQHDMEKVIDDLRQSSKALETEFQKVKKDKESLENINTANREKLKAEIVEIKQEIKAKLEQVNKAGHELQMVKADKVKIEAELNETIKESKKALEVKKTEIEALKSELQNTRSSPAPDSSTTCMMTSDKEDQMEAEVIQLKATIENLSSANNNFIIQPEEKKECKCSVTNILNADLQEKVDKMKGILDLRENEIKLRENEIKLKVEEIKLRVEEIRLLKEDHMH
jgi:chromosome segregation ATPase